MHLDPLHKPAFNRENIREIMETMRVTKMKAENRLIEEIKTLQIGAT